MKNLHGNKKFKISGRTGGHEFELLDRAVSDIQNYFNYIIKKHETFTDNAPAQIHVDKIQNRITFKIKTEKSFEFLTLKTMKLLASAEGRITKNGENVLQL